MSVVGVCLLPPTFLLNTYEIVIFTQNRIEKMNRILTLTLLASLFVMGGCGKSKKIAVGELNLSAMIQPVPLSARFVDEGYYTWGTSAIKGDDGLYHAYYSRWPLDMGKNAWVTHSEVAHAVSKTPYGPYTFSDVTLPERGEEFWDGLCTHNPTIHRFGGKYYLYYMGNTGDSRHNPMPKPAPTLNWTHRNNQRIGVAVADSPYGPWRRADTPLIDVSQDESAPDALLTSNPSLTRMADGRYVMVYKCVAKKKAMPFGGPVSHMVAFADSPEGPFVKEKEEIFTQVNSAFPAEDPYIWYQDDCYYAIVKDMHGAFSDAGQSLALFYSLDGKKWELAKNPLVSNLEVLWEDGTTEKFDHLERPQLLIVDGKPIALYLAADHINTTQGSCNIQLPLK